jgi:hypothetical protein
MSLFNQMKDIGFYIYTICFNITQNGSEFGSQSARTGFLWFSK